MPSIQVDMFVPSKAKMLQSESDTKPASSRQRARVVRFIDLFAGMGGTRVGFEAACNTLDLKHACVFTSEIKRHALVAYSHNFQDDCIAGDITQIDVGSIPDFDFLLAGFPCQPFSAAGKRKGLLDDRGNLFFNIVEILKAKQPEGFLLENVEGLVSDNQGKTLDLICASLESLGYRLSWRVLDASDFGVAQQRKRLYIAGRRSSKVDLDGFISIKRFAGECLDSTADFKPSEFAQLLMRHFDWKALQGKAIKDKRGGEANIHSWDIGYRGEISLEQKRLLKAILTQRRQKKWAELKGIEWMDGMPLTLDEIATFYPHPDLQAMLEDLTQKGYLKFEHPRSVVVEKGVRSRVPNPHIPKGYNIVTGKLSFPITKILDPKGFAPTLVATEAGKLAVSLPQGVRPITVREGLRLSGFPESYTLDVIGYREAFDLIGNTVMPPVIQAVAERLLRA